MYEAIKYQQNKLIISFKTRLSPENTSNFLETVEYTNLITIQSSTS